MPVPRLELPLIVDAPQPRPRGAPVRVKTAGDGARGKPGGVLLKDPFDDRRFGFVNATVADVGPSVLAGAFHDLVTVGQPTAAAARLDAAPEAAPRLVGEIRQEQRVHRALEADVQLADLALAERDDADVGVPHALEEAGHVLLVAADAVERLGVDEVEPAARGVLHDAWIPGGRWHKSTVMNLLDRLGLRKCASPASAAETMQRRPFPHPVVR